MQRSQFSISSFSRTAARPWADSVNNCDVIFTTLNCTLLTTALFLLRKGLPIALFLPRAQVEVVPHLALIPMLRNPLHLPVIVT